MPEVELPLNPSATAVSGDSALASGLARILVIDDEAAIRESLEVLLTLEGYAVTMAVDGEEGMRILDQDSFDLLLLDLALPGQSGLELLPQIKERHPDLPVIMITAYGTVDNVVDAVRAGAKRPDIASAEGVKAALLSAPTIALLEQRLRGRGDQEEHIARRLESTRREVERGRELCDYEVVNDDIERASLEILSILEGLRQSRRIPS